MLVYVIVRFMCLYIQLLCWWQYSINEYYKAKLAIVLGVWLHTEVIFTRP